MYNAEVCRQLLVGTLPPSVSRWRHARGQLAAVVLVALIVRGAAVLRPGALQTDPDGYAALARQFVSTGVFGYGGNPTAIRPPLYPLVLSACVPGQTDLRWTLGPLHLAWGLATVLLTVWLGRQLGLGRRAQAAGFLVACDPILVNQSGLVMTETLAALLAVATWVALIWYRRELTGPGVAGLSAGICWRGGALVGGLWGLALLCRPTFAPLVVCGVAFLPWWSGGGRRGWQTAGVTVLCLCATLAPWTARNWLLFGRPVALTTHGGFTLLLANNPYFFRHLGDARANRPWDSAAFEADWSARHPLASWREQPARDQACYREAWHNIQAAGAPAVWRAVRYRAGRFWAVWPAADTAGNSTLGRLGPLAVVAWYVAVYSAACCGILRLVRARNLAPWWWGLGLVISMTLVHAWFWSDMRMRGPAEVVLALLAAGGRHCPGTKPQPIINKTLGTSSLVKNPP